MRRTPIYGVWRAMLDRCYLESCKEFRWYGARGITVCDRWRESFEAFFADMGPRPKSKTIDRRDTNGPYSPENCRWATMREQNNNRRDNRFVTVGGERMTIAEAARKTGIPQWTIGRRAKRGEPI